MANDILRRYPEAYLLLCKALQREPYNRFFHYMLGFHFAASGRIGEAIRALETAQTMPAPRLHQRKQIVTSAESVLKNLKEFKKFNEP
jgi:hypothetical protein